MQPIDVTSAALSVVLALALTSCNERSSISQNGAGQASPAQASGRIPPAPPNDPDAQASALMAAAEPFENLTENAFTSDPGKLDGFIAKARTSAVGASKLLSPDEAKALSGHVAAIDAARADSNRADLAIAAVEGYRTLVSHAGSQQKVPKQVSLLDYSGFRFQADLKAKPIRWSDTAQAIDFADAQWRQIAATVNDQTLRRKMSEALAEMRSASQSKDAAAAMAASTRELDLVDDLEHYFVR